MHKYLKSVGRLYMERKRNSEGPAYVFGINSVLCEVKYKTMYKSHRIMVMALGYKLIQNISDFQFCHF